MTWFGTFGYLNDLTKGGEGSGIKGHTTFREDVEKMSKEQLIKENHRLYEDNNFDDVLSMWFLGGKKNSTFLENYITEIFGLEEENSRNFSETSGYESPKGVSDNLKKMYVITQEFLKREYPDGKVTLYRGVNGNSFDKFKVFKKHEPIDLEAYNTSSWSKKKSTAERFAQKKTSGGITVSAVFPIKRILTIEGLDKIALPDEQEAVIIGNKIEARMEDIFNRR